MLTTVRAFSSWASVDEVLLDPSGYPETDWFQIRDISGLGPVKADVNTSPLGSMDGDSFVGSTVGSRNIVLIIKPNPDWSIWTYEKLRRVLYEYFMPKRRIRLIFETDEIAPVEILGYVESNEPAIFSKDGEIQVSVICPYPYFTSVNPVVVDGVSTETNVDINYEGSVESGISVQVSRASGISPTVIGIQIGDSLLSYFRVTAGVDSSKYFAMSSVPGQKYVQNVAIANGIITNLLSMVHSGSQWPILQPGINNFSVITDTPDEGMVQDWRLTYYNRYGGL
jgi:Phage tail protein